MADMIPSKGRDAAHIILDSVIAHDNDSTPAANATRMNLALQRLGDIDAVSATMSDDGTLNVDLSDLLGGISVSINWLARRIAELRDIDRDVVISELREFIDATDHFEE